MLLAFGYLSAASISLILSRIDGDIAYCWIATALLMPCLAQLPLPRWPAPLVGCAIASMIASSIFGAGIAAAGPVALLLVGEAALGAWLLQRFAADGHYFDDVPHFVRFALLVGVAMPVVSAFGGATLGALVFSMAFWKAWLAWYTVHALGALIFTPVVVLLIEQTGRRRLTDFDPRRGGGLNLGLAMLTATVTGLVFGQTGLPMLYLPLLPLTLMTFRAGRFGAALGICILAIVGDVLTLTGHGSAVLASADHAKVALFFKFYLAVTVITMLPMAAELNRRNALARQLQDSEAMFRLMADRSGDILLNVDVKGRIRFCSSSVVRFGGFDPAALIGTNSLDLIAEDDRIVVAAVHGRALARPNETFVVEYRAKIGEHGPTWFESHTRAIADADGRVTGVVSAARDITDRKQSEAKLVEAANSDALTGLSNRRRFDDLLRRAVHFPNRRGGTGCLAIVDIDFFKRVNDEHGHLAGDAVLKIMAARLQPMLRPTDFVARIGGEEFGMVLWNLELAEAEEVCDRLRGDIAGHRIDIGTTSLAVTVSVGLADMGQFTAVAPLLAAADQALYRAKAEGRNCVRLAV